MPEIGAYKAKTHFSKILERVARGESFTITKHGVPIAVLSPASRIRKRNLKKVIFEIEAFGKKHTLGDLSLRDLIEEGRV